MRRYRSDSHLSGRHAPLEKLPPEVRRHILMATTPASLQSLTRASPAYWQQYVHDRSLIIWHILHDAIGNTILDAVIVSQTTGNAFLQSRDFDLINAWVTQYRDQRQAIQARLLPMKITEQQVVYMLEFQLKVIEPLADEFIAWNAANFHAGELTNAISATERGRINRALYRYQICSNLFGAGRRPFKGESEVPAEDLCTYLLILFEPWEIEEILCVYEFVKDFYHGMLNKIHWEIDKDTLKPAPRVVQQLRQPRRPRRPRPTPNSMSSSSTSLSSTSSTSSESEEMEDDENSERQLNYIRGISSLGLHVLTHIQHIAKTSDHGSLVQAMRDHTPLYNHIFLDDDTTLTDDRQEWLRMGGTLSTHNRQDRHEPLRFVGNNIYGPPLVWKLLWGGTYSSRVGGFIAPELRRWGYVFWDMERIERAEVKEELRMAWEERWDGVDLRNEILDADSDMDLG
ncbi:hypothetical protein K461DRAFT_268301 [Myriangium duriaei CBS 260.36]|uniref:Uncharacterized protein n=1 Tax=Myriangium duriaei CBS 260.36 TaxID=1168546 RepID=A0A9P4J0E2_9PEZI|nr:hypothetical protein K461DRAFT_268301 [Myriangium duriaei CBS 260.36]